MAMRYLRPALADMLARHGVPPRVEWTSEWSPPPTDYARRVQLHDVIRHVADARARLPRPARAPEAVLDGPVPRALRTLPLDRAALHEHQRAALDATVRVDDRQRRRVRSGVWILPCGSGKTRAGVGAIVAAGARTMIVAPNAESCAQWRSECVRAGVDDVVVLRAEDDESPDACRRVMDSSPPAVVVVTWKALALHGVAADVRDASPAMLCAVDVLEYDLLLLDEVHMLPASTHAVGVERVRAAAVVGMTAEVTRSDGRHAHLDALVGPVLHSFARVDAEEAGVTVEVRRTTMLVPAPDALLAAYRASGRAEERRLLALFNPHKLAVLRTLLLDGGAKKVFVYCDKTRALPTVAAFLERVTSDEAAAGRRPLPFLGIFSGQQSRAARSAFVDRARAASTGCALLSRAGSASLDVCDVDCVIEVDVCDGGVQKCTQRRGRAQRVHPSKRESARLYTLATVGTREVDFCAARDRSRDGAGAEEARVVCVAVDDADVARLPEGVVPRTAEEARALVDRLLDAPSRPKSRGATVRRLRPMKRPRLDPA